MWMYARLIHILSWRIFFFFFFILTTNTAPLLFQSAHWTLDKNFEREEVQCSIVQQYHNIQRIHSLSVLYLQISKDEFVESVLIYFIISLFKGYILHVFGYFHSKKRIFKLIKECIVKIVLHTSSQDNSPVAHRTKKKRILPRYLNLPRTSTLICIKNVNYRWIYNDKCSWIGFYRAI